MSGAKSINVKSPFPPKQININSPQEAWVLNPLERGTAIEQYLAKTEYSTSNGWYNVGAEYKGTFELVDFQKDNVLLSLKTVNTKGDRWRGDMEEHIDDLDKRRGTVNNQNATMALDVRVQPGGYESAKFLIDYGRSRNVVVNVVEF